MRLSWAAAVAAVSLFAAAGAHAQAVDQKKFNVVGTWNFLTNWKVLEVPFWDQELPAASGGKLTGNIKSVTELNLKGTEVLRLLKSGVYDFAAALPIYVDDGAAIVEAVDISGVARTFKMSRDIIDAWMPEMQKVMRERHGALVLGTFTWPEQNFYCRGDIKGVEDLKGKKVRVQGASQADLVKGFGGSAVTIPFGEVVPALEKGVVDCGITGTMPAYKAKWHEVTNTLFRLPVGFTASVWVVSLRTWNQLSPATQEL
ncbi:MAG TPA: TRAP transporter substrate-binding protein DctP, partial [Reyranella sp.]